MKPRGYRYFDITELGPQNRKRYGLESLVMMYLDPLGKNFAGADLPRSQYVAPAGPPRYWAASDARATVNIADGKGPCKDGLCSGP